CALLYSDEKIELIADASKAPPVDALLHELCLTPSRHSTELRAWTRQTARVAAWNSSWHEMSAWANLRSELSIVSKFFEFLPRTRTVVMHNGRRIFRPTALFSRSFRQGAFVHPLFLFDPELRAEMFGVGWQPDSPRRAALIFAGDAASPRRRILLEQCRRFMEKRPDAHIVQTYDEALSSPSWPKADKKLVLWMAALEGQQNTIAMALWP